MIAELWLPEHWLKQDLTYHGAYCVLMFQHVDDIVACGYLLHVARKLKLGARFVAQWLIGDPDITAPMNYPRKLSEILRWYDLVGLSIVAETNDMRRHGVQRAVGVGHSREGQNHELGRRVPAVSASTR